MKQFVRLAAMLCVTVHLVACISESIDDVFNTDAATSVSSEANVTTGSPCAYVSCLNNGICNTNEQGEARCYCEDPFSGDRCQCRSDWCSSPAQPCGEELQCVGMCQGYACHCNRPGFTADLLTMSCVDIDECEVFEVCRGPNEKCHNQEGSFTCLCTSGHIRNSTSGNCEEVDECAMSEQSICGTNADCINFNGLWECECHRGYQGVYGCNDIDECELLLDDCAHVCVNVEGSYRCECFEGFLMINNTCQSTVNSTINDTCAENCGSLGSCVNGTCVCHRGYQQEVNQTDGQCVDIDECSSPNPICGPNSICKNSPGKYSCICEEGYTIDEAGLCQDEDECLTNPCGDFASCTNTEGSYNCSCFDGYSMQNKCEELDECKTGGKEMCADKNADCLDEVNAFICKCRSGFFMTVNKCVTAISTVSGSVILTKTFVDNLSSGHRSSEFRKLAGSFERAIAAVIGIPSAQVRVTKFRPGSTVCEYAIMFSSRVQLEDLPQLLNAGCQKLDNATCLLTGDLAVATRNGEVISTMEYFNACHRRVVGNYCPPDSTTCQRLDAGNYRCDCKQGLLLIGRADNFPLCADIDECSQDDTYCGANSRCVNYYGGYTCDCIEGYYLTNGICEELCFPNPCLNEGVCAMVGPHDYECQCEPYYLGKNCEGPNRRLWGAEQTMYIISGSLSFLVVVAFVSGIVCRRQSEKKKTKLWATQLE